MQLRQKADRRQHHNRIGQDQDPSPAVPIGHKAAHQDERDGGQERRKAYEPKGKCIATDIVDEPRDRDGLDLRGKRSAETGSAKQSEIPMPEGRPAF
jgi:hypothetical protein